MKNVFEFIDYREFLRQFYAKKKAASRVYSYRVFAQKAGINSSSFLKHVMDGKRNLTPATIDKFCAALGLLGKEETYFRHLVFFNQAKTAGEKQDHYAVLRSLASNVKETVLRPAQYEYFSNWYVPVIRELVCLQNFDGDFSLLGRTVFPPIGAVAAHNAVRLLEKLRLIIHCKDGTYEQTETAITADDGVTTLAQREYISHMMKLGGDAVEGFDKKERHTSTMTIGISQPTFEIITAEIEAFKDRIKTIVNHDNAPSRVFQLNCAVFPTSIDVKQKPQLSPRVQP